LIPGEEENHVAKSVDGRLQKNNFLMEEKKTKKGHDDDDDDEFFEEEENQRAIPSFLMNIPGVTGTDSMQYRIEALRVYIENNLGDQPFLNAYRYLTVSVSNSSA
jgi:hypothetical protein